MSRTAQVKPSSEGLQHLILVLDLNLQPMNQGSEISNCCLLLAALRVQPHVVSCQRIEMVNEATGIHHHLVKGIGNVTNMAGEVLNGQSWQVPVEKPCSHLRFPCFKDFHAHSSQGKLLSNCGNEKMILQVVELAIWLCSQNRTKLFMVMEHGCHKQLSNSFWPLLIGVIDEKVSNEWMQQFRVGVDVQQVGRLATSHNMSNFGRPTTHGFPSLVLHDSGANYVVKNCVKPTDLLTSPENLGQTADVRGFRHELAGTLFVAMRSESNIQFLTQTNKSFVKFTKVGCPKARDFDITFGFRLVGGSLGKLRKNEIFVIRHHHNVVE